MRRNSEWFDRHPKTRIALQLVLDGLPFLMSLSFLLILAVMRDVLELPYWLGKLVIYCSFAFMLMSIPLVVTAFLMRYRLENRIEEKKIVRFFSTTLEILSCMVTVLFLPISLSFSSVIISNLF